LTGLVSIHEKDFIHWDIKPENIMFRKSSDNIACDDVVLIDFGFSAKFKANPKL
jgi:serine/threonine protein kinase